MKESNDICKVCLVVTYEQHFSFWKLFEMFGPFNLKLIDNTQPGVRENTYNSIYNGANYPYMLEFFSQFTHQLGFGNNR